jgi:XapX domain-containing protein
MRILTDDPNRNSHQLLSANDRQTVAGEVLFQFIIDQASWRKLMTKLLIAFVLAFGIGAFCRWFEIPAPSPPKVPGALLVLAMTLGYVIADYSMQRKDNGKSGATISSSSGATSSDTVSSGK